MTDPRPSIAELQRLTDAINYKGPPEANRVAISALVNAAPVLLEIAAAALAWRDRPITDDAVAPLERLLAAIDRVSP